MRVIERLRLTSDTVAPKRKPNETMYCPQKAKTSTYPRMTTFPRSAVLVAAIGRAKATARR
jgi:hypothetical protein